MTEKRHSVQQASALAVLCLAGCVLLGWAFDIGFLKSVLPGLTTMKANTAVGLALAATTVLCLQKRSQLARCSALAAGSAVALLGLLTLVEYGFGVRLGLDELLFADTLTTSAPFNGRMSPATAISFAATGASLVLLSSTGGRRRVLAAHLLAAIPAACGFISLAGYSYGVEHLYRFGPYVSVALHTAVSLLLLSLMLVLTRRNEGWARRFTKTPAALAAFLRMSSLSLIVSFYAGLLVVHGERANLYDPHFSPTLFALIAAGTLVWLAFQAGSILARAESEMMIAREEATGRGEELAKTRSLNEALVEGLPQLVWTCLPDGSCNYLSPQWVEYTGVPEAEQLGFGWLQSIDSRDLARTEAHWLGAVAGRHPYDIEYRLRRADGTSRWFKTRGVPLRDAQGNVDTWFGSCTDIQELVAARELLTQSREDLERQVAARTAELMDAEEKLRQSQKMEAVGQLTGGIAHDFNNLLTGIMGSLERLQVCVGQGRYEAVDRYVSTAHAAAERAAALTHRLLAFSRRQTLDPRPTDANRLVAGMEELIRRTVGPAITLEVVASAELCAVLVDPPQLESALLNLAINARDAMHDGGRITIETTNLWLEGREATERDLQPGAYVSICLTDTGCGMPPEIVSRAFDPFFTTKPLGLGTGLGLSMVYGFVRQSGGQAKIHSMPAHGTSIHLYLPSHASEIDNRLCSPTGAHEACGTTTTVLVVDDESFIRMLVTEVLDDLGYASVEAEDGPSALEVLRATRRIDLLITDVGLPGGMNGLEVAEAVRAERPGLPVLFITGYAGGAVLSSGQLATDRQLLTKPFSTKALANRIGELLQSLPTPGADLHRAVYPEETHTKYVAALEA